MMPIAKTKLTDTGSPMNLPIANTTVPTATATAAISRLSAEISCSSGDGEPAVV
jgi:hypothetical protein